MNHELDKEINFFQPQSLVKNKSQTEQANQLNIDEITFIAYLTLTVLFFLALFFSFSQKENKTSYVYETKEITVNQSVPLDSKMKNSATTHYSDEHENIIIKKNINEYIIYNEKIENLKHSE